MTKKCDTCGVLPELHKKTYAPYGLPTDDTQYYYVCPKCGKTSGIGLERDDALATVTKDQAIEIARIKWNSGDFRQGKLTEGGVKV